MTCSPSTAAVVEGLLKAAGEGFRESGLLAIDVMVPLHIIHGPSLLNAMDLIDNEKVKVSPSLM